MVFRKKHSILYFKLNCKVTEIWVESTVDFINSSNELLTFWNHNNVISRT